MKIFTTRTAKMKNIHHTTQITIRLMQNLHKLILPTLVTCLLALPVENSLALEYSYKPYNEGKMDPQLTGWPLTKEESDYVAKGSYLRRPGSESGAQKIIFLPYTPSADGSLDSKSGKQWYVDVQEKLIKVIDQYKHDQGTNIDILLVGDSITWQWIDISAPYNQYPQKFNEPWQSHFGQYTTFNIGVAGDKTQGLLWRLDHGGTVGSAAPGLNPRLVILAIGHNDMYFTPETGTKNAALGVLWCVKNVREKFPDAAVIVSKILPNTNPQAKFYIDAKAINAELDSLIEAEKDSKIHLLPDMWGEMTNPDGSLNEKYFRANEAARTKVLLSIDGYQLWADKMKPIVEALLSGKPIPASEPKPKGKVASQIPTPAEPSAATISPSQASFPAATIHLDSKSVLTYPYVPYNEGKVDPQITGWPLTEPEMAWVLKEEYTRKPGHEVSKHLPEMWAVTPTAGHWKSQPGKEGNPWLDHHATIVEKVQAAKSDIEIALIGDSITQGWGGGWDNAPFNAAWQKHFGQRKTVNLGIGGDRTESVLWRLDHGALDGASPKMAVLHIGVNNAPLVTANGVTAASVAQAIQLIVQNIRARCPQTEIVVLKILPAFEPGGVVYNDIKSINTNLDALKLEADSKVHILDLWSDFTNADGTLKKELYSDGHLHLGSAGYEVFASKLKPVLNQLLAADKSK